MAEQVLSDEPRCEPRQAAWRRVHLAPASVAVYRAKAVWRSPQYAGLLVARTVDTHSPAAANDADVQCLRREHARG